jgi:hypothetical protein
MIELYVLGMCDKEFHFFSLRVLWVLRQNKIHFTFTSIDCDHLFSEAPSSTFLILLFQFREANAVVASFAEYDSC